MDYGFALAVFNSHPELKALFTKAVAQTWTPDKFIAELRGTKWFKTTSDTAREWAILSAADPKTAAQRTKARQATFIAEAGQMGVKLSKQQLTDLTNNSIMFGWTDVQARQVIGAAWKYSPTTPSAGLAASTITQMRQTAADYAVPVSDGAIQKWTQNVLEGNATPDDFLSYAKTQAKGLYGEDVAKAIDSGATVAQYADPYKQLAVQNLGINPDDVNWTDPKWNRFLNNKVSVDDPTKKLDKPGPMSLADATQVMRSDSQYGYDQSANGQQTAAQFATQLASRFGAV